MNFDQLLNKKNIKLSIIISLIVILVGLLPYIIFETHPIIILLHSLLDLYTPYIENITNLILKTLKSDVFISNNELIFNNNEEYVLKHKEITQNWPNYIMFKKWSAIVLFLIWITFTSAWKKILFTAFFTFTHFFSVISGLILFCSIGPNIVAPGSMSKINPSIIGSLAMLSLLLLWIKTQKSEMLITLSKIKLKPKFEKKTILQIIIIVYAYLLLKDFIIPYFNFYSYIKFLLIATKSLVSIRGYEATIDGPYLVGYGGTLFMAKWCLGFLTMYTFSVLVYLTSNKNKTKWIYIISGIVFLHVVNIIRLAALFIFVQNNDSTKMANDHHDVYNIIVYIIIFILWVIWFEKFADIRATSLKKK